ncbi:MAG: ubiquinone biosynthesis regulatory protein kinase UbiB [Legionellales bacterium]|nr:ubiquinone biosynthesis regulatory protein kinase UbiB [Legionellales bacterium]|tara:strand:+ start:38785 stop:40443 length:1659 start_codon:yes stop_codon:yes gene_type:complete
MSKIRQFFRLFHINFVLAKHGLDEIILAAHFFAPIRFLKYFNPWFWFRDRSQSRGERVRLALQELGPIFVKLGQMLSTRVDLLPQDIIKELSLLQDKVPPFANAREQVEAIYESPVEELFSEFNPEALASASIAQVHAATLRDGHHVVVKILRPGVDKIIKRDIALMYSLARMAERYWSVGKRLHLVEIIGEFEHSLMNELDLTAEAANASQLRRNFQGSPLLYIPEVYWPYTRTKAMVMERIHGIPIYHIDELKAHDVDFKVLAERGVEIFFTQVFRDCFFHADMHPGNIFVDTSDPKSPRYLAVDFGIMGTLSTTDQRYLAENMLAFFKRDYHRVAALHLESGWVPPETKVHELEAAIRTVCEPIFEKPLKDISFANLLLRLLQVGKRFNMEIQPQLTLLQKTLLHIESLGRQLYPDLDLWTTAKPFLERWLKQQVGPKAFIRKMRENLPTLAEKLPDAPGVIYRFLEQGHQPPRPSPAPIDDPDKLSDKLRRQLRGSGFLQGFAAALFFAALLNSLLLIGLWHKPVDFSWLSIIFASGGLLALLVSVVR